MNSMFDKLNLRPQEQRLVVIVGIVVFVVLNFVFVFPNFGAFGRLQQRRMDARKKLDLYKSEIGKQSTYEREINTLKSSGVSVATEEQVATLADNVNSHAALSGVYVNGLTTQRGGSTGGRTNAFFEEQSAIVSFANTGEKELVDFLYRLADKEVLIRARSMEISPEITRMKLQGRLTLVKSFQRKPPARAGVTGPAPAAAKPTAPAAATTARTNQPAAPPPVTTARPSPPAPVTPTNPPLPASRALTPLPTRGTNIQSRMPTAPPAVLPGAGTTRIRRLPPTPIK